MDKASWTLFWLSVVLMLVGGIDRLTAAPLIEGVAPGTFWKGAIGLVSYSIALSLLPAKKRST
jgi:hypothetical protein